MLKHVLELLEILDDPAVTGKEVVAYLDAVAGADGSGAEITTVPGPAGKTDFVRVRVSGSRGRTAGGDAPTLGVVGRLGGVGARPEVTGFVSDGDGAAAALAAAAKLLSMRARGDVLAGDVLIGTHICPDAPTLPHDPVPFMNSPVDIATMNSYELSAEMAAVLSIDTTKGNRVINHRGLALSPTVRSGYILRVSEGLGELLEAVTGAPLVTYPITTQDITPYGNGVYHLNSILQPATATDAPVVGLAITSAATVAGCATGTSHETDIAAAARYAVEVAKQFGAGALHFHDETEFASLRARYGSMAHLQTLGTEVAG
ncbi:DUF1177 domain-containing protein [Amycolatopsis rubida]|uniref:DUF1177 domain-containing protein n=1 Tax=Amycolatopsis rubida TaxID=112413 RepID=A0ABX0C944_9PSEU|nr:MULTISPECIES: DUF1177 domain-containing protein [Amycolatopsis]MYW97867.1 DUF1177 family protein [Amycolatopsis rubida]NEC62853.1 DUF1177 domain-containing protein [Amycolatopsis rubida]OAP24007.1 hypothetical protein A4R44_05160 [Amycolatopsis sp. M39]